MKSQKIIQYEKPLEPCEDPIPLPEKDEVLLKVIYCGVCHTDVHINDGYFKLSGTKRIDTSSRRSLPFTPGHEIFGEVTAIGKDVKHTKVGDRRAVFPWIGCGECSTCLSGSENLCDASENGIGTSSDGGYSEYVIVPHERYLIQTEGIEDRLAATYMCSGVTAFSAIKKIGAVNKNEAILILGLGGVGFSALQISKAIIENPVFAADVDDGKLQAASKCGAAKIYNTGDTESCSQLIADTNGGIAIIIDFVGSEESSKFALQSLRRGGKYIVVGLYGGELQIPLATIPLRAINIIGSLTGSLSETKELIELAKTVNIQPIPMQDRRMDQASATLDDLRNGNIVGRIILCT